MDLSLEAILVGKGHILVVCFLTKLYDIINVLLAQNIFNLMNGLIIYR